MSDSEGELIEEDEDGVPALVSDVRGSDEAHVPAAMHRVGLNPP